MKVRVEMGVDGAGDIYPIAAFDATYTTRIPSTHILPICPRDWKSGNNLSALSAVKEEGARRGLTPTRDEWLWEIWG